MATVVTGLACSLSLQSAAYLQGLNAAAMATTNAANKMQRAFGAATAAANATTSAVTRQAAAANAANAKMASGFQGASRGAMVLANSLKAIFAVALIREGVRDVISYADAWQNARNKLAAAEQIAGVQGRSMAELNKIAIETRAPIEDIVDLYAKLIRTASGVVDSEADIAQITKTVAEGFRAGGASTLEQVNGIRQLAQALGSGILQGDELRSIRENAPLVAKAIADELGTTVAGLKKLGAEGKITSEVIARALIKNQEEVHAAFLKTNPTIADSFVILNDAIGEYIDKLNQGSGASRTFAVAVKSIAINFNPLMDSFFGSGSIIGELNRMFFGVGDALKIIADRFTNLTGVDTSGWFSTVISYASKAWEFLKGIGSGLREINDAIRRKAAYGVGTPSVGGRTGMGHAFDYEILGDRNAGFGGGKGGADAGGGAAAQALEAKNKAFETHRSLINDVGSAQEKYLVQLDEINTKNYTVADAERAKSKALMDYQDNLDKEAEAIGLTLTPLQEYEAALRKVADAEENGRATAEMAYAARAGAAIKFAETYLSAFGNLTSAATQLFKDNKALSIANAIVNTAAGIAGALGAVPWTPLNFINAAAVAVAGAAQIATILSTQPGSTTTPTVKGGKGATTASSSDTSVAGASTKKNPSQTVNITVQGESGFSAQQVRDLIGHINEAVGDGVHLMVS